MRIQIWLCMLVAVSTSMAAQPGELTVLVDSANAQYEFREAGVAILRYNHGAVEPGAVLEEVSEENLKYARARSDYIHPLFGPKGEVLTLDFPVDHPHHRGIYWAWPEVEIADDRGDLHALQKIYSRPKGQPQTVEGEGWTQLEAENHWQWEDREPVVRERVVIRVHRLTPEGRYIDLRFSFWALTDGVTIARRDTDKYGGLNIRLNAVQAQEIILHTETAVDDARVAWAELSGKFPGSDRLLGLSVFQKGTNPDYPGDWIEYPEINWFQPTFPAKGSRFRLDRVQALDLEYRLWLHEGKAGAELHRRAWKEYQEQSPLVLE